MTWRLSVAVPLAVACLAMPVRPFAQAPAATDLLDRYLRGDFDAVVGTLASFDTFGDFAKDLESNGPAWIASAPAGTRARRELVAATVALEAARLGQAKEWKIVRPVKTPVRTYYLVFWMPPARLLEWGCVLLRARERPSEAERWWHLASVAVAERGQDGELLVPLGSPPDGYMPDPIDHAVHLQARLPDEARIKLAFGIADEWQDPNRARAAFEQLRDDRGVGAEATLRLGAIALRRGDVDGARSEFARVERMTRDPWLLYLARFLTGRAADERRRPADAEAAYRQALRAMPRTQSASIALAALLFQDGRRAEASAVTDAMLESTNGVDPWRGYADADDRFWPELIGRVRAEIHP